MGNDQLYRLISLYWRYTLFTRTKISVDIPILDYGGGLGQVSAALPDVTISDPSVFARDYAYHRGRKFISVIAEIPRGHFGIILSSHSLEHAPRPADLLMRFHHYATEECKLILLLPNEYEMYRRTKPLEVPRLTPDLRDQHLYCWTFQTITNLLAYSGWEVLMQSRVYGPFMLRTLARTLNHDHAVWLAHFFGRYKKNFPSLLVVARRARCKISNLRVRG